MSALLFASIVGAVAGHLTAKAYDSYAEPVLEDRHNERVEEFEEEAREEARAEARRRRFEAFANASNGGYPPYGTQPQMPALYPQSSAELMGWQAAQNSIAALQQQLMQKQAMPQAQPVPPVAPVQAAPQAQPVTPTPAAPTTSASDAALVQVLQQLNQRLAAVEQLSNLVSAAIAEEAAADATDASDDATSDVEVIQPEENQKRDSKGRFSKK